MSVWRLKTFNLPKKPAKTITEYGINMNRNCTRNLRRENACSLLSLSPTFYPNFHLFAFHNRNNLFLLYVFLLPCGERSEENKGKKTAKKKFYLSIVLSAFSFCLNFLDKQRTKLFIIFLISTSVPIVCVQKGSNGSRNLNNSNKITLNWIIILIRRRRTGFSWVKSLKQLKRALVSPWRGKMESWISR